VKRDEAGEMYVSSLLMCMVTDRSAVLSLVSLKVVANVFFPQTLTHRTGSFSVSWRVNTRRHARLMASTIRAQSFVLYLGEHDEFSRHVWFGIQCRRDKDALNTFQRTY